MIKKYQEELLHKNSQELNKLKVELKIKTEEKNSINKEKNISKKNIDSETVLLNNLKENIKKEENKVNHSNNKIKENNKNISYFNDQIYNISSEIESYNINLNKLDSDIKNNYKELQNNIEEKADIEKNIEKYMKTKEDAIILQNNFINKLEEEEFDNIIYKISENNTAKKYEAITKGIQINNNENLIEKEKMISRKLERRK